MEQQISIAIKKIKEIEFSIDEQYNIESIEKINLNFELTTNINPTENIIELVLSAKYSDKNTGNPFLKIKTSNMFLIRELSELISAKADHYDIPDKILITMLSLSISHTRALLAKNTLGTKFSDLYIPIVNPTEIGKQLFSIKNN